MLELWSQASTTLAQHAIIPALHALGLESLVGDASEIAGALLLVTLQIAIIGLVFRPLETFWPAEEWSNRTLTRVDRNYTLLMLLGIFPIFTYLILMPLGHLFGGATANSTPGTEFSLALTHWVPWFEEHPWWRFGVYYLVYDCVYYWMHRTQHVIPWWWAMHSMHHSTRQMGCWANDRGSLLDGFLQSIILASVGLAIGIDPEEFAALMLLGELVQNLSHTNTRLGFGRLLERVLVAPRFHRLHHMQVDAMRPNLHNCNFGQVFSIWDNLFGTALYDEPIRPTGVTDPSVDSDNGLGVIGLQWVALKRFWASVWRRDGWRLGEVAFEAGTLRPIHVENPLKNAGMHAAINAGAAQPDQQDRP